MSKKEQDLLFWRLVHDALKVHGEYGPETDAEIDAWVAAHPLSEEELASFEKCRSERLEALLDDVFNGYVCGLCGGRGADKVPHPCYWPGELRPGTKYVHAECEQKECERAFGALTEAERAECLRNIKS